MPKRGPFSGFTGKMPSMEKLTRTGKQPAYPVRSVGGSGHRAGHGAQEAVTSGSTPGLVPGVELPNVQQGGSNGNG